tara:strand:+ start:144 stop:1013 length:870 start_codon:yes stop_codon:yes gene_type:complete
MAEKSISYGIGLSDQMINQMLQSSDPSIVAQAQDYINQAQAQQEQKPNLLQRIGNFFISPAASAEVVMNPQGNLVDTEGNINFFNTGTEQVFPRQGLEPLYPNFGAPMVNNTFLRPDVSSSNLISLRPETGINTLRFVNRDINNIQPQLPANRLEGLNLDRFKGIGSLGVANEEDEEQVDYLGSKPNKFQEGIARLFEFFKRVSPIAAVGRGLESLRNKFDTRRAIRDDIQRDTQGTINQVVSPRIMNIQPSDRDRGMGRQTSSRPSPSKSRSSGGYGGGRDRGRGDRF